MQTNSNQGNEDGGKHHSLKAKVDNEESHINKTDTAAKLVHKEGNKGIDAKQMAKLTGWEEHRSCASALSRAKAKHPEILYRKTDGTHGVYYTLSTGWWA